MSIPWIKLAKDSGLSFSKSQTFNLATVALNGAPRCRSCVARGWLFDNESTGILKFTTDKRMDKVVELQENDQFEACFYFASTAEQFRIAGHCRILSKSITPCLDIKKNTKSHDFQGTYPIPDKNGNKRIPSREEWDLEFDNTWSPLSSGMKTSFKKPEPGKKMTQEDKNLLEKLEYRTDELTEEDAKNNFLVMLLIPTRVDYIDIKGLGKRQLFTLQSDGKWIEQELCP